MNRDDPIERMLSWLGYTTAALLAIMVMLTVVDVVGRYFFNVPVPGSGEATELLLGLLIYCAVPLAALRHEHIRIDILDHWLSERALRGHRILGASVSAVVMAFLVWRLKLRGDELARFDDHSSHLDVPLALIAYFMAAMAAITVVVFVIVAIRALRRQS